MTTIKTLALPNHWLASQIASEARARVGIWGWDRLSPTGHLELCKALLAQRLCCCAPGQEIAWDDARAAYRALVLHFSGEGE